MKIFPGIVLACSAASGICWAVDRHTTAQLQKQLDAVKDRGEEIAQLRRERDRLLGLQNAEINAGAVRDGAPTADIVPDGNSNGGVSLLRPGTWAPTSEWKNQGSATPEAAVETMLWAAAGGDVGTLKDTLTLAPEAQSTASDLLATLSATTDRSYASPEDLMALLVAGNVPLDSAQIVAKQINQDGRVIEYLRLRDSEGRTRQVYLALQKVSDSWRLTVPASALVQMVQGNPGANVP
jgi:hypothetical protein